MHTTDISYIKPSWVVALVKLPLSLEMFELNTPLKYRTESIYQDLYVRLTAKSYLLGIKCLSLPFADGYDVTLGIL